MDDDSQNTRPDENMDNQENPAGNPNDTIANTPITVSKMWTQTRKQEKMCKRFENQQANLHHYI